MLELDALSVRVGGFELGDLSLKIDCGEYFVLLGPTGAGKTVLLELIAGLVRQTAGAIRWRGLDLTPLSPEVRPIAAVFQDLGLFPHLSVAGNIGYGPKITGVPKAERLERIQRLARLVQIESLLDRSVDGLSGGEKQRVALARALAVEPEVLLLDEPLSALDPQSRDRLQAVLRRVHNKTRTTVLHVTHDREIALSMADRVAVLLDHRLYPPTEPTRLFLRPQRREVAEFLGLRNILEIECSTDGQIDFFGHDPHWADIRPGHSVVWIRPEEIHLVTEPSTDPTGFTVDAEVVSVALLGSQVEARVVSGALELTALLKPSTLEHIAVEPGSRITVMIPEEAIHVFPSEG